jgi:hypothetical protein
VEVEEEICEERRRIWGSRDSRNARRRRVKKYNLAAARQV